MDILDNRIVIVEDDEKLGSIYQEWLELFVSRVFVARNGKECMEILAREKIDLVITDVKMPIMDGYELIEKIKEKYLDLKTIMLTAYGDKSGVVKALRLGAYDYLDKPVKMDLLEHVVRNALAYVDHQKMQRQLLELLLFNYSDTPPENFQRLPETEKNKILKGVLELMRMKILKKELKNV